METAGAGGADRSPLDRIREAEAGAARRVAAAREHAEQRVTDASLQARKLVEAARKEGEEEARSHYAAIITAAQAEARTIAAEAETRAGELRESKSKQVETAVRWVVGFVTGIENLSLIHI